MFKKYSPQTRNRIAMGIALATGIVLVVLMGFTRFSTNTFRDPSGVMKIKSFYNTLVKDTQSFFTLK